jgi:phosphoribosylaminoimidazole (AIR) synthetase
MFRAFNMGVGMIVVATTSGADAIVASAAAAGMNAWQLGRVQPGSGRVILS